MTRSDESIEHVDVLIVGAGMSGVDAGHPGTDDQHVDMFDALVAFHGSSLAAVAAEA